MIDTQKKEILKNAKTIAILGLSPDEQKPSNKVARYLLKEGYKIIPIYPKGGEILGCKAYVNLNDAFKENAIDILDIFRKSEALFEVAQEILSLENKPKCVWVQLGLKNKEAKELLESKGFLYEEDSCIKLEHERLFV